MQEGKNNGKVSRIVEAEGLRAVGEEKGGVAAIRAGVAEELSDAEVPEGEEKEERGQERRKGQRERRTEEESEEKGGDRWS